MTDLPETMTAIDPEAPGGPEVLRLVQRPVPMPAPGEVLIRVAAAGVNRPDAMQRAGKYPPPPGAPSILGLEVAGEVVAVGAAQPFRQSGEGRNPEPQASSPTALDPGGSRDDEGWSIGDEVCALVAGGGYAEYVVAPAATCLPVPAGLSMVEAAALPETVFTVWSNLFQRGRATAGEVVLVHGGTSGIGTMAIKLGGLFGLDVIVTGGSPEKCAAARDLGAAHAIDYRTADFVEEVRRITGGRGVDVVLDMIGGDYLPRNLTCLAVEGRHVSIAIQRGAKGEVSIWDVMSKRLVLTGSTLRARAPAFKAALAAAIAERVWPHVAAGRLRPAIDVTFPLARAADAHRRLEAGDHVGKIVLTMG